MMVTATIVARHRCPYRQETDHGSLTLYWSIPDDKGDAPELHGIAEKVRELDACVVSHEDYTRAVLEVTGASQARTYWTTAGMTVTCDLSREPLRT